MDDVDCRACFPWQQEYLRETTLHNNQSNNFVQQTQRRMEDMRVISPTILSNGYRHGWRAQDRIAVLNETNFA
jgi:hypothetical protein